ncbi:MAG: sugar porter family MFS transporter [Bacteroides uniformis]|uniref:sugar porter family MFS transporter n=1 Tax=Bacteroides TaxID=816 RepID=UPI0021CEA05F|nr:sugar porter family MFS transporter [Bacteroides uniformis]MDC1813258.1 sugar porter family MFS transporter [Bacteroides uniformis]MDC1994963.1 sugar porter family MFS transporter [Bacteroides uniformis]MDC1998715.1 sugar porter family MFS transporter [Bacteroides uniformis]MDC2002476.1 sugar porter family MFS transporter [Bacteroides uniformis]
MEFKISDFKFQSTCQPVKSRTQKLKSSMKSKVNFSYLIFLSVVAALGGFLFGYDAAVISGTISQVTARFSLDEIQVGWFVGCALIGSIIGVLMAGKLSDRWGRKVTMLVAAVFFSVSGIACAFVGSFEQLVVARILGGIGIGVVSIVSPLYISEVSIAQYRGRLVSLYQLAVTIGFLGAYLTNFQLLHFSQSGAVLNTGWMNLVFVSEVWRGMLGFCSLPAILFFCIIFFIPESPRWLILKGRDERAVGIFRKIYLSEVEVDTQLQDTKSVVQSETKSDWKFLLQPGIFKAVLIGAAIAILGQFMGVNAVLYYGPTIFEEAGLSGGDALFSQVLVGIVNVVTTVIAVFIIDKVGRKKLVYYGVSGMVLSLLLIGFYFHFSESMGLPNSFLLFFFLFYVFCCAISISAVIFVLLSEMYPTRIRGMAMSIAGFALWIGTYLVGQLTPWMLQNLTPTGTFLLFALMCVPYMLIVWKLIPETTGKSLEEIERYWMKKR